MENGAGGMQTAFLFWRRLSQLPSILPHVFEGSPYFERGSLKRTIVVVYYSILFHWVIPSNYR